MDKRRSVPLSILEKKKCCARFTLHQVRVRVVYVPCSGNIRRDPSLLLFVPQSLEGGRKMWKAVEDEEVMPYL